MTAAFKFVFVILLELCLFVEYDLGKSNHINVVLYPRNRPGRLICITTRIVWALSLQYDAGWKFSIMNQWPGMYSKSGQNGRKKRLLDKLKPALQYLIMPRKSRGNKGKHTTITLSRIIVHTKPYIRWIPGFAITLCNEQLLTFILVHSGSEVSFDKQNDQIMSHIKSSAGSFAQNFASSASKRETKHWVLLTFR